MRASRWLVLVAAAALGACATGPQSGQSGTAAAARVTSADSARSGGAGGPQARPGECYAPVSLALQLQADAPAGARKPEWERVVCQDQMSRMLVRKLQRALRAEGFSPGAVDGKMGPRTLRALNQYEKAHRLRLSERGVLPYATLRALGMSRP